MTNEAQVKTIAQETADAAAALSINRETDTQIVAGIIDKLALATYCGRKEEFSVAKFRINMLLVAGYCLAASGDDIEHLLAERIRQDKLWGDDFDRMNTVNDWNAYVTHYLAKSLRNNSENFSENMLKASGIAQAAILMVDRYGEV